MENKVREYEQMMLGGCIKLVLAKLFIQIVFQSAIFHLPQLCFVKTIILRTSIQNQQTRKSFQREVKKEEKSFLKIPRRKVQNNYPNRSCNMVTGVLDNSINVSKKNSESSTVQSASLHIADTLRLGNKDEHTLIEQQNPNAKWRPLVDLLIKNELKFDDYTNNNQPVSKLSDAVQHLSRTSITTKRGSKRWKHTLCVDTFARRRVN